MKKQWHDLVAWLTGASVDGVSVPTGHLCLDSRQCTSGDVFIAITGGNLHGVAFAAKAKAAGAWVVSDREDSSVDCYVPDLAARLPALCNWFYDEPSKHLQLIGITGTNGKTSTSHYVAQWLALVGKKVAVMGTVGNGIWGDVQPSTHTTPDICRLYRQLAEWCTLGVEVAVMEVSSHAIVQQRIAGLDFAVLALTQVTRDHLDYHQTEENYHRVKRELFLQWPSRAQVINALDTVGQQLLSCLPAVISYATSAVASVAITCLEAKPLSSGMQLTLQAHNKLWQGEVPLFGQFNIENLCCAMGCVLAVGVSTEQLFPLLPQTQSVAGRMQLVAKQPVVLVDYAHTPDALAKSLSALRWHSQQARILLVFGAGGNRDQGKRPLMGAAAEAAADEIVLTDDNPRDEVAAEIASAIQAGMQHQVRYVPDRRTAICQLCQSAHEGDVVLIAGKGHEDYQEIAGVRYPFSDVEVVKQCLA